MREPVSGPMVVGILSRHAAHDSVRVVWMVGPQGFGRSAAEDGAFEAAWIAHEIGRPVRMQWMREEETAWDTKGPAFLVKMRGALESGGTLMAYDFHARSCDHNHVGYNEPDSVPIAQLMGTRMAKPAAEGAAIPSDMYAIPNRKMVGEVVGLRVPFRDDRVLAALKAAGV